MGCDDAIVIYKMLDGRTIAVELPEWAVDSAKRNGREDNMPVIAVIRPRQGALMPRKVWTLWQRA